jgi:hypothetical protein
MFCSSLCITCSTWADHGGHIIYDARVLRPFKCWGRGFEYCLERDWLPIFLYNFIPNYGLNLFSRSPFVCLLQDLARLLQQEKRSLHVKDLFLLNFKLMHVLSFVLRTVRLINLLGSYYVNPACKIYPLTSKWYLKIQFGPLRKHTMSPLRSPMRDGVSGNILSLIW